MKLRTELARLKQSRRSVRPEHLDALLQAAGFVRRHSKGDHWVYTHPRRRFPLTVNPRNPLLPAYVSKAIRAIEEILNGDEED